MTTPEPSCSTVCRKLGEDNVGLQLDNIRLKKQIDALLAVVARQDEHVMELDLALTKLNEEIAKLRKLKI